MSVSPKRQEPLEPLSSEVREKERQEEIDPKDQEHQEDVIVCDKCTKIFTNNQTYQTHVKTKHRQEKQEEQIKPSEKEEEHGDEQSKSEVYVPERKPSKKIPFKNRMLEIQQNELEDTIYAFLGELGEKNIEPTSNRSEFILHNENQRLTGQTNYSVNKVVRTPYEEPIKVSQSLPLTEIEASPHKDFLKKLKDEIIKLEEKIEAEREIWELRDPMAPEEETQDEFSLMDIRKLIFNYPKRKVHLKFPHFSIFLLWIARICKPPAFKEFFMIMGTFLALYHTSLKEEAKTPEAIYEQWKSLSKQIEQKPIDKELLKKMQICDEKSCKKLVEFFVEWSDCFKAINI